MSIPAVVYNRSWLKTQWAKLLMLIVLIVEAAGSSNQKPVKRTQSLPLSPPEEVPGKTSLSEGPSQEALDKASLAPLFPDEGKEAQLLVERVNNIKALLTPPKGESVKSRRSREKRIMARLRPEGGSIGILESKVWRFVAAELIEEGHLQDMAFVMQAQPDLFRHNRKDFAYSHAAVEQLAKKADDRSVGDILAVTVILHHSDCNEFMMKDFAAKMDESCAHIEKLKNSNSVHVQEISGLVRMYRARVSQCNKDHDDPIKENTAVCRLAQQFKGFGFSLLPS